MDLQSVFKIAVLGDEGTGKSSLISQYVYNVFKLCSPPTIGAANASKVILLDDRNIKFIIWDTAGQEKYRSISKMLYRDARAVILVFDVTSRRSFESLDKWHKSVVDTAPSNVLEVIVGNKVDLDTEEVNRDEVLDFAKKVNAQLYYISAKTGERIDEVFYDIASALANNKKLIEFKEGKKEQNSSFLLSDNNPQVKKRNRCC